MGQIVTTVEVDSAIPTKIEIEKEIAVNEIVQQTTTVIRIPTPSAFLLQFLVSVSTSQMACLYSHLVS
jgi:hypothetical protein